MKPILLSTLSFILFALTTNFPLSFTQESVPVKDTDGNPLVPGAKYYILPSTHGDGEGGGLSLGKTKGQNCPITIIQDFSETFIGLPVKFNVKDGEDIILKDYSKIDVEFDTKPECAHSSKWVLVENNTFRTAWISIGSIEDIKDSNGNVINGVFNIKEGWLGYSLVYQSSALGGFSYINSYDDVTGRRLVIVNPKGHPEEDHYRSFDVKFVKASGNGRSVV